MAHRNESDLVMVPGHGVCKAECVTVEETGLDSSWIGIFPGEGRCYAEHAAAGVAESARRSDALLVFSGGQTRRDAGPRSEAESYWEIADAADWWGHPEVRSRALKEEYARDSFENLLYALALFRQATGRWPRRIQVCGWDFKRRRFELHRDALRWPVDRFEYLGVNNPPPHGLADAVAGETAKVASTAEDPFLLGTQWVVQRERRNPFQRSHPYRGLSPDLDALFDFLDHGAPQPVLSWT